MRLILCAGPLLPPDLAPAPAAEFARREGSRHVALVDEHAAAATAALSTTCSTILVAARHGGALLRLADVLLWTSSTIAPPPIHGRTILATPHPSFAYPVPTVRLPARASELAAALG